MGLMRNMLLWASRNPFLRSTMPRYAFVRRAVTRFMPGEELPDALRAAEALKRAGIASVLTYLGENITRESEAETVVERYREALAGVRERGLDCHISVKLTQLGYDISRSLCLTNLDRIVAQAAELGNFVWIDMEGSSYTGGTLETYREIRRKRRNLGVCLQSYLFRTAADVTALTPLAPHIRLVKGTYAEPPAVAFRRKSDNDANYLALARQLLERTGDAGVRPAFATHDEKMLLPIRRLAAALHAPPETYEFQMLYGIRPDLQRRLAAEGNRMRVLISYGTYWFPWYMRRLAERPANVLFVLKNIFRSAYPKNEIVIP